MFEAKEIDLKRDVCSYLKMTKEERKKYENRGKIENEAAAHFTQIENAMI